MVKKLVPLLLLLCLLTGCGEKTVHRHLDYTLFDTVTVILGTGGTEEDFTARAEALCRELGEYHRLFDIYHEYEGMVNLATVNRLAGEGPVEVDPRIYQLLEDGKEYYTLTEGRVNIAMGSVLSLWHDARTQSLEDPEHPVLPEEAALRTAAEHCSMEDLILENGTVFFKDPQLRLDVGAVAKGWSVQKVCDGAPEGILISVGGDVCATGPKGENTPWIVGIQNPDGSEDYLKTLTLERGSAVTSGDYQRFFEVNGKKYHHIIDPDTLQPETRWRSVTILSDDSGLADALSTALFLLTREEGEALARKTGTEALWLDPQGELYMTPGFEARLAE